ncbi:uncharacterized protein T26G10.4-like [Thrips palmi]|uniref:Uncharacterized protein T26G10.4-like n=1 Tax=Thrips palmi TaxID=161013 RepID=A0A6P8ZC06_THRPL|nr:uncharacterized protein T26G10.4-like [Thrips palmi]
MQAFIVGTVASWVGLELNAKKCATLAMRRSEAVKAVTANQGQPIQAMQAADAYQHLGVPGLYVNQTPEDAIKSMPQDLAAVKDSLLAPWQKLDAVRTFILPQAQFVLQATRIQKTAFQDQDKATKSAAKQFLHLPDRASNEIIYIPCRSARDPPERLRMSHN